MVPCILYFEANGNWKTLLGNKLYVDYNMDTESSDQCQYQPKFQCISKKNCE